MGITIITSASHDCNESENVVFKHPPPTSLSLKANEPDLPHQNIQEVLTDTRKGRSFWTILDVTLINWALWSLSMGLNHKMTQHTGGWSIPGEVTSFFCLTLCLWDWETRQNSCALPETPALEGVPGHGQQKGDIVLFCLWLLLLCLFQCSQQNPCGSWETGPVEVVIQARGGTAPASCLPQFAMRTRWGWHRGVLSADRLSQAFFLFLEEFFIMYPRGPMLIHLTDICW